MEVWIVGLRAAVYHEINQETQTHTVCGLPMREEHPWQVGTRVSKATVSYLPCCRACERRRV